MPALTGATAGSRTRPAARQLGLVRSAKLAGLRRIGILQLTPRCGRAFARAAIADSLEHFIASDGLDRLRRITDFHVAFAIGTGIAAGIGAGIGGDWPEISPTRHSPLSARLRRSPANGGRFGID